MHILTVGIVTPGFEKAHFERETDSKRIQMVISFQSWK